jgi:hypothetical protein
VVALLAGDVRNTLAGVRIENHRVGRARDVEEFVLWIDRQVAPATLASDLKGLRDAYGPGLPSYYDSAPTLVTNWLNAARPYTVICGVMYTTWKNNYGNLETFEHLLAG